MEIPSFSTLWDTCETLSRLESSIREIGSQQRHGSDSEGRKKWRPQVSDNYYSDGICGVTFGIERPEFCHPLKTCCDHHFFTEEEFRRHEAQHVKCPHEECSVVIHPSVLNFHIETVHSPEVFARLNPVLADKSIVLWRDSRKKNYPTFERVQAKIRETGYRIQRGQVLLTKQFGSLNKRKPFELRDPNACRVDRLKGSNSRHKDVTSPRRNPENVLPPASPSSVPPPLEDPLSLSASDAPAIESQPAHSQSPQTDDQPLLPPPPSPSPPGKTESDVDDDDDEGSFPVAVVTSSNKNMPVGCLVAYDYDSDLSWEETPSDAEATMEAAPMERPKVAANTPQIPEPTKSTPTATSLLDQLSSLKPQFSDNDLLSEKTKESAGRTSSNAESTSAPTETRPPPSTLRRGRRGRDQPRGGGRPRRGGGDNSQSEGRGGARRGRQKRRGGGGGKETAGAAAKVEEDEDEEGASGVAAVFASHPVVRMASKRRECMRNAALMAKRPTLLQMLLAEDMRRERNQLMQCVRFVVRNKFFR